MIRHANTRTQTNPWNAKEHEINAVFLLIVRLTEHIYMTNPKCNECGSSEPQVFDTVTHNIMQCNTCGKWMHSDVCGGPIEPDIVCIHCKNGPPSDDSDGSTIDDSESISSNSDDNSDLSGFIVDSDASEESLSSEEDEEFEWMKKSLKALEHVVKKQGKTIKKLLQLRHTAKHAKKDKKKKEKRSHKIK